MTKEIIEGNKLIAEFMGWAYHKGHFLNPDNPNQVYKEYDFTYHSSWDWLMPVVEKIRSLGFIVEIIYSENDCCRIWAGKTASDNGQHYWNVVNGNNNVLETCVQFIQWYNENKIK